MSADIEVWPPPNDATAFESLCLDLWQDIWQDRGAQKNGRNGQPQAGVDVFGQDQGRWVGVQCKQKDGLLRKEVTFQELSGEVEAARQFKPLLARFILATTGPRDEKVQQRGRELTERHRQQGLFTVEVWSWEEIWRELHQREKLLKRIAPTYWPRLAAIKWGERTPADVTMIVSVATHPDQLRAITDTALSYALKRSDIGIHIEPSMAYLSKFQSGGPIEPIKDTVPFQWAFPTLDVSVVNNSKRTVLLAEAVFRVEESRLDPMPVLIIRPDAYRTNALHFSIWNEGWGEVHGMKARFHISPLSDGELRPVFTEPYPYEAAVGDFLESVDVCIADALRAAGADLDGLSLLALSGEFGRGAAVLQRKKLRTHADEATPPGAKPLAKTNAVLGPFQRGGALVSGELAFEALTEEGTAKEMRVKFSTTVWLYDVALLGVPLPPTSEYTIKLEVDGKNYERRMQISHALKPGEADRFTIKTGMDKSSRHIFRLRLTDTERHELESPIIHLVAFVPRTGKKCEAQTPQPIGSQADWPPFGWGATGAGSDSSSS